jgi:hypothetical protein
VTGLFALALPIIAVVDIKRVRWIIFTVCAVGFLWYSTTDGFRKDTEQVATFTWAKTA